MTTRRTGDERARALAVLGLPERATAQQITDRFRSLAKATHPDTAAPAPDATQRLTAICDAYHLLAAPEPPPAAQPRRPARPRGPAATADQPWIVAGPVRILPFPARTPHGPQADT